MKTKLFIYGSCVGRDIVRLLPGKYTLLHYAARQSWISAASLPLAKPDPVDLGPFSKRSLVGDFTSNVPMLLRGISRKSDVILIDIATDRHGVYRVGSSYISNTGELKRSNLLARPRAEALINEKTSKRCGIFDIFVRLFRRVQETVGKVTNPKAEVKKLSYGIGSLEHGELVEFGSSEHKILFNEAAAKLSRVMKKAGLLERALVLQIKFAGESDDGQLVPLARGLKASEVNEMYEYYYEVLERMGFSLTPTPPPELVVANSQHKWGLQQDHFIDPMYHWWADRIDEFAWSLSHNGTSD